MTPASDPAHRRYSRRPLTFPVSRRDLFRSLLQGARRGPHHRPDTPAFPLAALGGLPDEQLLGIVPVVTAGCRFTVGDGTVYVEPLDGPRRPVMPAIETNVAIIEAMDGRSSLAAISAMLAARSPQPPPSPFGQVRDVFLALVEARVVVPA